MLTHAELTQGFFLMATIALILGVVAIKLLLALRQAERELYRITSHRACFSS